MGRSPLAWVLTALIKAYQAVPKPGNRCRFHPTCSAYGLEAVQRHGGVHGSWLLLKRLARCHPWGGGGIDPVPPARDHAPELTSRQTTRETI